MVGDIALHATERLAAWRRGEIRLSSENGSVVVREATSTDAPGMARVHVDTWRTTYRGLVPDSYLDDLSYTDRQAMWEQALTNSEHRSFIYVAQAGDSEIVGFASGGPIRTEGEEYEGELYSIYILASQQGKGTGRRLVEAIVRRMLVADIHSMLVWVLAGNPAERFYVSLGGVEVRRQPFELGGVTLDEVGYGWRNIATILERG
jgi:L-amino acid N-acyltransferase YncA